MSDTLDPKASGVGGPLWLPLKLDDGVATLDYSKQISINAKAGEIENVYPGSLLSQGKPATASSADTTDSDGNVNPDGWTADYANDGNYNTEWKASSSNYPAWWEVDLGQEYDINNVQLSWWMIGGSEATQDFQIQVSDDGVNWSVGYDMSSGDKQYGFNNCDLPGVQGRYVRVWIIASHTQNNNGGWYVPQLYEARVYGASSPSSATVTTPDSNGDYSLDVPSNIANYPATGNFTLNLGNVSATLPTADLLSDLGHGTLTAVNGKTSSSTLSAITSASKSDSKVAGSFDLGLSSADGTVFNKLGSPAQVTVKLTKDEIAALSGAGTPKLFRYDAATKSLVDTKATIDLAKGTATFNTSTLGSFAFEQTGTSVKTDRVSGADRYATSVAVSKQAYPKGADVAVVAAGGTFPDALSAGPAAAKLGGPVLLTGGSSLPGTVKAELQRLKPKKIVVVGGTGVVSNAVSTALGKIAPVTRVSGADRYATSIAVAKYAFSKGASKAFIATGADFPDALSAGAAIGAKGPVILVKGTSKSVDAATSAELKKLAVKDVYIAGGTGVVSTGFESGLKKIATTTRLAGSDRYATSLAINAKLFTSAKRVLFATGADFPDALAGTAWAPVISAPLFEVQGACVPKGVLAAIGKLGASRATLLGGTGVLNAKVASLTSCTK